MTEHEKLKEICDAIGYIIDWEYYYEYDCIGEPQTIDVRLIIFTTECMEKLAGYLFDLFDEDMVKRDNAINKIMLHLDDPVSYLYNLIIGN